MSAPNVEPLANDAIPATAHEFHNWELEAWEAHVHPPVLSFVVVRGKFGDYDGYVEPQDLMSSSYVMGWLVGLHSKPGR